MNLQLLATNEASHTAWQQLGPRAALAGITSLLLVLLLGRPSIAWLRRVAPERIISPSPEVAQWHKHKQSTPTMGGLLIVAATICAMLLTISLANPFVPPTILLMLALLAVGAWDDLAKLRHGKGLSAKTKLAAQTFAAALAAMWIYKILQPVDGGLYLKIPWGSAVSLGWWLVPLATLVIVGSSNAVNLTDGLDGLAGGCMLVSLSAIGVVAYLTGQANLLLEPSVINVARTGEITVIAAAAAGGVAGFLWFNRYPARWFMGDTGSLPLGGLLGLLAVIVRQELLLVLIGGVFVAEAASVIMQVGYFKMRGRRLLRCAPLHHHFQFLGWSEKKIVARFWIAAVLCAAGGLACLQFGGAVSATKGLNNGLTTSYVGAITSWWR